MSGGTIKIEGRVKKMGSVFGKFLRFKRILPLHKKHILLLVLVFQMNNGLCH